MIGQPIVPDQAEHLHNAFLQADKKSWCCFVPFLCAFSLEPNRIVCVNEVGRSICLTVQRPDGVDLLMPPIPFDAGVFGQLVERCAKTQDGQLPRILWIDAADRMHLNDERYELIEKDAEYIYDPSQIAGMDGPLFKDLRKRVRRFERIYQPVFRPMTPDDVPDCKELLKHWRHRQGRKHPFLLDWGYTLAALDQFQWWSKDILRGWCVEIDGQIDAFGLVGEMQPDLAQFFVAKADPELPDLSYYLRWRIYDALSAYRWVNDAGDLGLDGMRQFKQKFRPVDRWQVFSAEPK